MTGRNKSNKDEKNQKKDIKESPMEYKDLCITCNNLSTCDSTRAGRRPVYYCEQFDDYIPPKADPKPKQSETNRREIRNTKYKGICMNCDNRETCKNSTSEAGIWHCEEYT